MSLSVYSSSKSESRMPHARWPELVCALALVAAAPAALAMGGCGGGAARGAASGSSSGDGVRGAVTIENRSQLSICRVEIKLQDGNVAEDVELEPGQSVQVQINEDTNRMFLTECGGQRTFLGHPMNWYGTAQGRTELFQNLQHDHIVLYDPGTAPSGASDHRAVDLNPRPISDWMFFEGNPDRALAQELHSALVAHASRGGWSETFEFSIPLGQWDTLRNRYTGIVTGRSVQAAGFARWADGHCTMQAFGFEQSHNGSNFSGPLRVGVSTQLPIPCAVLTYAAGLPSASPNSAASAGGASVSSGGAAAGGSLCTNTCNSSNDGECDDGGPNSLYNVCALGTDCADCGAR